MLRIDNKPVTLYSEERAVRIAQELQSGDDEWSFVVRHTLNPRWFLVQVLDEEGGHVGYWNEAQ